MHKKSLSEYKIICDLTKSVIDDISKYTSLIFTSSGAVIIGIGAFVTSYFNFKNVNALNIMDIMPIYLSFSAAAISIITLLMLVIVLYKCDSHNRLLGYRTLLSTEIISADQSDILEQIDELHSFDYCMSKMRSITGDKDNLHEVYMDYLPTKNKAADKDKTDKVSIATVYKHYPFIKYKLPEPDEKTRSIDEEAIKDNRWKLISQMMLMSVESSSWSFPTYVTSSVLYISIIEILFALVMAVFEMVQYPSIILYCATFFFMTIYIRLIVHMLGKIWFRYCQIMVGSKTIESYVWRFMPIRCRYLYEISNERPDINYI